MPEGDTVWNTASALHQALAGQVIQRSDFRVPALATVDLSGWRVTTCQSRGKHLLIRVTSPGGHRSLTLHSHMRMDGAWRVFRPGERWRGGPAHLIRIVLHTASRVAVGYHLHDIALVPTDQEERLVGHLGPDLMRPAGEVGGWDQDEAVRRLTARPDRPIVQALLDQRNLAGIGNVYASEVLFLSGIHPATPISKVDDLPRVVTLAHRLLNAHRGRWTRVTTGLLRRGGEMWVYGREGEPCRRCGTPIVRRHDPGERVSYWCPRCQPAPT